MTHPLQLHGEHYARTYTIEMIQEPIQLNYFNIPQRTPCRGLPLLLSLGTLWLPPSSVDKFTIEKKGRPETRL